MQRKQVWDRVELQVKKQVRDSIFAHVRGRIKPQTEHPVWDYILGPVRDCVVEQVEVQVQNQVRGQFAAEKAAHYLRRKRTQRRG